MKTVFVSKQLEDKHPLKQWAESKKVTLIDQSLIAQKIHPKCGFPPKSDWIFFSSPLAAQLFAEHFPHELSARKIAALGKGTARYLNPHAQVRFEGSVANTERVAKAFANHIVEGSVLFPQSQISGRSVQQYMKPNTVRDWLFYETLPAGKRIEANIYFFTSPSNFNAFAEFNEIDDSAIYLAIGDKTADSMREAKFPVDGEPQSWKAHDWIQLIQSYL